MKKFFENSKEVQLSKLVVRICLFVVRECMIWTVLFEQKMTKKFFFFGKVYRVAMGNDRS